MKLETLSDHEVVVTLLGLGLLLFFAYVMGKIFELLKVPKVVGEITGGIILGGSVLHHFFPDLMGQLFSGYNGEGKVLNLFYQLGLMFLMMSSGFNTNIELNREKVKGIALIFVGATILPMLASLPFISWFQPYFMGEERNVLAFALVFTIGISITSIPVISKIFFDIGIMNTEFSNTVLTVSTFQDLCLWILLNASTRMVTVGEIRLGEMLFVVACTLGMFVIMYFVGKRAWTMKKIVKSIDFFTLSMIALFIICGAFCIVGINIMYSAFFVGCVLKIISNGNSRICKEVKTVTEFTFSLFIPIYFALVGIQINLWHNFSFGRFLLFFIVAFLLEGLGTILMLLFSKYKKQTIINFAITMNARGGPGIVLATVAYSYGIINAEFFTVLILTTMLSSMIAGYWLRYQKKKHCHVFTEL